MKKIFSLFLVLIISLSMVACSTKLSNNESSSTVAEIALVTDVGTIEDKSFNQGSWEGVIRYSEERGITHKYYQPTEKSNEAITDAIELAIKGGAKTVIAPGYLFEVPVYNMQEKYQDVKFIILDGIPRDKEGQDSIQKVADNTLSIFYSEEQAGFLAGYAAVIDGYRKLGFMGGIALPSVIRYGYGFIQGAEYAAKELGLNSGNIVINYTYLGNFEASPDNMTKAATWYNEGIEVIFACGGGVGNSVMKAAEAAGKKVIGVDVDQSVESETVITSAMKNLQNSIHEALNSIYNGTFQGGQSIILGVDTSDVLLPMETSKFKLFSQEQYDIIYNKIINGEVEIYNETVSKDVTDIITKVVKVKLS